MNDCEYIVDGYHYSISNDWITVYRGGARRYRIRKTNRVLARLTKLQDGAIGKAKTAIVVDYIMKHGVPCFKQEGEKNENHRQQKNG